MLADFAWGLNYKYNIIKKEDDEDKSTIIGIFSDQFEAEGALDTLGSRGYNPRDLSIVYKEGGKLRTTSGSKGGSAVDGAISGGAAGSVLGGLTGMLIGLGVIAIPGIGGLLIGGPIAALLGATGAAAVTVSGAATGALAGSLLGGLVGLGIPKEEAHVYEDRINEGAVLLAVPVHTSENISEVKTIFDKFNAGQVRVIAQARKRRHW